VSIVALPEPRGLEPLASLKASDQPSDAKISRSTRISEIAFAHQPDRFIQSPGTRASTEDRT
jgi:hypothetical protein